MAGGFGALAKEGQDDGVRYVRIRMVRVSHNVSKSPELKSECSASAPIPRSPVPVELSTATVPAAQVSPTFGHTELIRWLTCQPRPGPQQENYTLKDDSVCTLDIAPCDVRRMRPTDEMLKTRNSCAIMQR